MKADVSLWLEILNSFRCLFTSPSFTLFCSLVPAWCLCTARHTITGIYRIAAPLSPRAHDSFHRFFRCASWSLGQLWALLAARLIDSFFCPTGPIPLLLDDTAFHKTGRKIVGAGWWRDAVRSTAQKTVHCFGLNIVVLALRISPPWGGQPLALPLTVRLHTKGGATLLDLAEQMVVQVASWFPQRRFHLCADGFYAPLAGRRLPQTALTSHLRHDAALYELLRRPKKPRRGRPRKKGNRLPTPAQLAQKARQWSTVMVDVRGKRVQRLVFALEVVWYAVCPDHPVLLVICRDPSGKQKDDFFFTTDVSAKPAEVVERYASRWAIEETFKNVKQGLGAEEPQLRSAQGPERVAAFSFWLYSVVWLWFIKSESRTASVVRLPWYPQKSTPSFTDAMASLRRLLWRQRIFPRSGTPTLTKENAMVLIEALAYAA
jgi:hypothetical protein